MGEIVFDVTNMKQFEYVMKALDKKGFNWITGEPASKIPRPLKRVPLTLIAYPNRREIGYIPDYKKLTSSWNPTIACA